MGKTGGGTGTNQYQVRGSSTAGQRGRSTTSSADAMLSAGYRRCGEVWGTKCPKLVSHPNWSHDKHPSTRSKRYVANDRSTSPVLLQDLAHDEDWEVRWAVAGNPNTPPDILDMLADDSRMGISLVYNKNTRQDTLQRLLPWLGDHPALAAIERLDASRLSPTERLMKQWAGPPYNKILRDDTPGHVLSELYDGQNGIIRDAVIKHPNTPPDILRKAATSKDFTIRASVGGNRHTPTDVLADLARDSSRAVRWRVAENPSTPVEVLDKLAGGKSDRVRKAATQNLARNPSTPVETLFGLALDDEDRDVREAASLNPSLPEHMRAMVVLGDNGRG